VVRFLCLSGKTNKEIVAEMQKAYGSCAPSRDFVEKWGARFRSGRTDIEDDPRSGRPEDPDVCGLVLQHFDENPHMSLRSTATALGINRERVRLCLKELRCRYARSRWIPHFLTPGVKARRVSLAKELLTRLKGMTARQMRNIILEDESWFYYDNPHEGRWLHEGESPDTIPERIVSSEKRFVVVFWSSTGPLLVATLEREVKFKSVHAVEFLNKLDAAAREMNRPKNGIKGMRLHWDNAKSHVSKMTMKTVNGLGLSVLPHPPYSPDLSPSDFFLFGYLKEKLKGRHFPEGEGLEAAIIEEMTEIGKEMMQSVMENWKKRLIRVIELRGEYYDK